MLKNTAPKHFKTAEEGRRILPEEHWKTLKKKKCWKTLLQSTQRLLKKGEEFRIKE